MGGITIMSLSIETLQHIKLLNSEKITQLEVEFKSFREESKKCYHMLTGDCLKTEVGIFRLMNYFRDCERDTYKKLTKARRAQKQIKDELYNLTTNNSWERAFSERIHQRYVDNTKFFGEEL